MHRCVSPTARAQLKNGTRPATGPTSIRSQSDAIGDALRSLAQAATCCAGHPQSPGPPLPGPSAQTRRPIKADRLVPTSTRFILPDVTVVEPERRRLEHVDVVVSEGRIADIRSTALRERAEPITLLHEYAGGFVLPGLIDMHGHLPPDNVLDLGGLFALLHLAHGVTSVRDAGDVDGTAVAAVRRGMAEGRYDGPRLFCAGMFITTGEPRWKNSIIISSPDEADAIAARLRSEGYHSMKLYENLTVEMIRALVDAAARCGLKVLGHVPARLGYEAARMPDAQHLFGIPPPLSLRRGHLFNRVADWGAVTPERMQVIVEAAVKQHLANTPTLVVSDRLLEYERYEDAVQDPQYHQLPRLYRQVVWNPVNGLPAYRGLKADDFARLHDAFARKRQLVKMLFDAGARLHLGTDVQQPFIIPGAALIDEMRLFERAGIAPGSIWSLATHGAAEYLEVEDLGGVSVGALADLGVYERDPTLDLAQLSTLRAVVSRGALYDKRTLDARVAREQSEHEGFFFDRVEPLLARVAMWRTARNFVH